MAIDYPNSPSTGDHHTHGGKTWTFHDGKWALNVSVEGVRGPAGVAFQGTAPTTTDVLWADTSVNGVDAMPIGGTTGQMLTKASSTSYDAVWATPVTSSDLALKAPLASPTFTGTVSGITKTMVGLGSVDNTADSAKPVSTTQQTALDLKAPLASPAFTGTPTSTTAAAGTNNTQIATTAYADAAVAALVDSAPATLNTLDELALALGDDANFATTTATAIGLKAPLASPTFTGAIGIGSAAGGDTNFGVYSNITGATTAFGIRSLQTIQSGVTTTAQIITSQPSTTAAAFTLTSLIHFRAESTTIGSTSAVTNQFGFSAGSNLTTATGLNVGFHGNIASGTNRYNIYMDGTAGNYMAGRLGVGQTNTSGTMALITNTTAGDKGLIVRGHATQTGSLFEIQNSASTALVTVNYAGEFVGMIQANKNFGNSYAASFAARADSSAQGLLAGYSFYPTFVGTGDNGVRRAADISAGFTGAWGTEYLAFGVGIGASNDTGLKTTERMRIDGAGNVGIGTTTPSSYGLLSVGASIGASATTNMIGMYQSAGVDSATMRIAGYSYTGAARTAIDFVQNGATNFNSQMVFSTSAGAGAVERMRITSGGDVGIGTGSPTVKLQVTGTTHLTGAGTFPATGTGIELTPAVATGTNYIQAFSRDAGTWQTLAINSGLTTFGTAGSERMRIDSTGQVGIGATPAAGRSLSVTKNLTGSTSSFSIVTNPVIQSDVTTEAAMFRSSASTAAAAFTIGNFYNYQAFGAGIGAGSAITTQFGYFVGSGLTTATNNYGFYGDIASTSGRFNLYMNGTAGNYMAGRLGIGATLTSGAMAQVVNTTAADKALVVKGTASQTGNLQDWQDSAGTVLAHVTSAGAAKFVSIDGGTA